MLEEVRKTAAGAAILKEWVGAGLTPVDSSLANGRALICSACPKNTPGNWWAKATGAVASAIRIQMQFKNNIAITTPLDDKLGTCVVCLCNLPLKVWCPTDLVRNHTTEEQLALMPHVCWIKQELTK